MIKNCILGKLCPVFHLPSAAVASRQNLNQWPVWPATVGVTLRRSTPCWEGWILRQRGEPWEGWVEEGVGGSAVENYTTSINHFYTTFFLSPSFSSLPPISLARSPSFCFFPSIMTQRLPLLICSPTARLTLTSP